MVFPMTLRQAYNFILTGQYEAAEHVLDSLGQRGLDWWRLKALLYSAQQRSAEALSMFEAGLDRAEQAEGQEQARFHSDFGGFLLNQEDYVRAVVHLSHVLRYARDSGEDVAHSYAAYNLAWVQLQVGRVDEAALVLEQALARRRMLLSAATSARHMVHCGRSLVAFAEGDVHLALSRAELAVRIASDPEAQLRGQYLRAMALQALQQHEEAIQVLRRVAQNGAEGDLRRRAAFFMALWQGGRPAGETSQDKARVLCYEASWALQAGQPQSQFNNFPK